MFAIMALMIFSTIELSSCNPDGTDMVLDLLRPDHISAEEQQSIHGRALKSIIPEAEEIMQADANTEFLVDGNDDILNVLQPEVHHESGHDEILEILDPKHH